MKRLVALLVSTALGLGAAGARAEPNIAPATPPTLATPPTPSTTKAAEPPKARVEWKEAWPKVRWWEYASTVVVQGASLYVRWYEPPPLQPRFYGYNPFDDTVRSWLVADTPAARARAGKVSDWVSIVGSTVPFTVDLPVALLVHRNFGVAWQLGWISWEATAVANFVNNFAFYEVGRGRPDARDCRTNPSYDPLCGFGDNASLPSGHTVTIATATGLVCQNHEHVPLFGGGAGDRAACAVMAVATATTGVSRIMADRHFTTDVLLGATLGFSSGYLLPWALHYRYEGRIGGRGGGEARTVALLPFSPPGGFGLGVLGLM
jgi:membrane-associated phospholipid phosphatase